MSRVAAVVAAILLALSLSGCDTSPGVVTGRHVAQLGGVTHYFVQVKHQQSGRTLDEDVPLSVFTACTSGDRWPERGR